MPYKHSKTCATCLHIKAEVGKNHHGRKVSPLFKAIDDYHMDKRTLASIADEYVKHLSLASISNHANNHQTFTSEDIAQSQIQALQRKTADEKIKLILKSSVKAEDMRGMVKQMFEEIMADEEKREAFKAKLKPSDVIKMVNDEESIALKQVDTANELMKTMNAFASGGTVIDLPTEGEVVD